MHIVIDGRMILPEMTGVGRYLLGLVAALGQVSPQEDFELLVQQNLPDDHPAWNLKSASVQVTPIPLSHMSFRQHWQIPGTLRKTRPDLFHYPHFDLPVGTPGPLVITIHDLKYLMRPDFFPHSGTLKRGLMRFMMAHATHRAEIILVDSEHTRQDVIEKFNQKSSKVRVSYLGVEPKFFVQPSRSEISKTLSTYGLHFPYFLFVGERRPHKNLPNLIRAFTSFHEDSSDQNLHLIIAGKPYSDYVEPQQMVKSLQMEDRIHFFDYVADQSLPVLYRQARAFTLPSYYEGFGLPVLEAMASGTPVIAGNTSSLPEIVGQAGLLVNPNNPEEIAAALRKAHTDVAWRGQISTMGSLRAHEFTWERCARDTLAVYQEVVANARP